MGDLMTLYRYHVALMVPDGVHHIANQIAAETTGNIADMHSFAVECIDANGAKWWACRMPMTPANYERLPEFQNAIGGHYELLREYTAERVDRMTFDEALALHGLERVGGVDE
jgi:hypothetical protein